MTTYIKNIISVAVPIRNLNLTVEAGDIRKVIADFDIDYIDAKNELDILIDDKKIELINSMGQEVDTSELFKDIIDTNNITKTENEIQTEDTSSERFYYVEDFFCLDKAGTIKKKFKGNVDTLRLSVKNTTVKYRIISEGVTMPWQLLKMDKENILNFEYRLKDAVIEIYADKADAVLNIYIDGYVSGIAAKNLQNFIDTWYENQSACSNNEWGIDSNWWKDNRVSGGIWENWNWSDKVGTFIDRTINLYTLSIDTKIEQQNEGAKLIIPAPKSSISGLQTSEFKIFKHDELSKYTIEMVQYNDWSDWNPKAFNVTVENVRFLEFDGTEYELATMVLTDWDDRWTEPHYYATTGLKFVSTTAGFTSAIGSYTVDLNGKPKNITLLVDNQKDLKAGDPITSLASGEHDFFIIANGSSDVTSSSVISFDNSGDYPALKIDGVASDLPVFFSDPALNYDDKDHFVYKSDDNGGTNICIEDLPGLGDEDFDDIILNVNFPMTDKIMIHTPETIEASIVSNGMGSYVAIPTAKHGINLYSMGEIEKDGVDCIVWRLRNGNDTDLNVGFYDYDTKETEYFTIPAHTDVYKSTDYTKQVKMFWNDGHGTRYTRKHRSHNDFNSDIDLRTLTARTLTEITKEIFNS